MNHIKKFFLNFEEIIGGVCLVVMAIFIFMNTFSRLFFNVSIPALDEISYTLFAYVIFVGSSSLYKRYGHGVIDLIVKLFPEKVQAVISIIISSIMLVTNAFITYLSAGYCVQSFTRKTQTLHVSYSITSFSLVLAFFCMTIHSLMHLRSVIVNRDYFHEKPIYDNLFTVDSIDDMVKDSEEQKEEEIEELKEEQKKEIEERKGGRK